ncbi:MAG: ABC transporter substrate-binding protein, partial [Nitrospirota bacterium]
MVVGIPREIKTREYRVALTPAGARELVGEGHVVIVEKSAGSGSGFADAEYEGAGARIAGRKTLFAEAELIVKVKEPLPEEFDLFEMSWIGDNGDPDNHLYILLSGEQWPPAGYNMGFYKNDQVDAILQEARTTLDRAKRTELYRQAQKLIAEDPPWIIVDHETQIVVMDQKIKNFKLH